jgi:hypothetical protein
MQFKDLTFGVPKEIMRGERRVSAIPDTVKNKTKNLIYTGLHSVSPVIPYFHFRDVNSGDQSHR